MGKIILYHGTPDKYVMPKYGGEMKSMTMARDFI